MQDNMTKLSWQILGSGLAALLLLLILFRVGIIHSTLVMSIIFIIIPLIPIVLYFCCRINLFAAAWNDHWISRVKYVVFIIQSAILIFAPYGISDEILTHIVMVFVFLNIMIVAIKQYQNTHSAFYFLPAIYLMIGFSHLEIVHSKQYLYFSYGIGPKLILDYLFWFLAYPNLENRLPVITHATITLAILKMPTLWIVVRNFTGLFILCMAYNKWTYALFFDSRDNSATITNFERTYQAIYPSIFILSLLAGVIQY